MAERRDDALFDYHAGELMKLFQRKLPEGANYYTLMLKRGAGNDPHLRWTSVEASAGAFDGQRLYWSREWGWI